VSKSTFPFHAEDISALARALGRQFDEAGRPPGHLEWLSILARVAALSGVQRRAPPPAVDHTEVRRWAEHFDAQGRTLRWPAKFSHQVACLWVL
jgi:hypothetical protein